jgi:hypothetical protein
MARRSKATDIAQECHIHLFHATRMLLNLLLVTLKQLDIVGEPSASVQIEYTVAVGLSIEM